jgi:hypothetical protein
MPAGQTARGTWPVGAWPGSLGSRAARRSCPGGRAEMQGPGQMPRSEWLANGAEPCRRSLGDARERTRTHAQALQDPTADPWRSEVAVLGRRAVLRRHPIAHDDLEAGDARLLRCHKAGRQEVPSRVGWEPGRLPAPGRNSKARQATMPALSPEQEGEATRQAGKQEARQASWQEGSVGDVSAHQGGGLNCGLARMPAGRQGAGRAASCEGSVGCLSAGSRGKGAPAAGRACRLLRSSQPANCLARLGSQGWT